MPETLRKEILAHEVLHKGHPGIAVMKVLRQTKKQPRREAYVSGGRTVTKIFKRLWGNVIYAMRIEKMNWKHHYSLVYADKTMDTNSSGFYMTFSRKTMADRN
ncbi:hypothetical protein T09_2347 [Trichinella sp. T9]|nr:hypothetical protein T09_2347 [Trichinella sp. T9]